MTDSTTSFLVLLIGLFVSFRCRTASCFQHQHHGICGVGRIYHHHNVRSKTNNRVVTILRLRVAAKEEEEEDDLETSGYSTTVSDRRSFFHQMASSTGSAFAVGTGMSSFPARSYAKSYSENASNLERINAGDYSGRLTILSELLHVTMSSTMYLTGTQTHRRSMSHHSNVCNITVIL